MRDNAEININQLNILIDGLLKGKEQPFEELVVGIYKGAKLLEEFNKEEELGNEVDFEKIFYDAFRSMGLDAYDEESLNSIIEKINECEMKSLPEQERVLIKNLINKTLTLINKEQSEEIIDQEHLDEEQSDTEPDEIINDSLEEHQEPLLEGDQEPFKNLVRLYEEAKTILEEDQEPLLEEDQELFNNLVGLYDQAKTIKAGGEAGDDPSKVFYKAFESEDLSPSKKGIKTFLSIRNAIHAINAIEEGQPDDLAEEERIEGDRIKELMYETLYQVRNKQFEDFVVKLFESADQAKEDNNLNFEAFARKLYVEFWSNPRISPTEEPYKYISPTDDNYSIFLSIKKAIKEWQQTRFTEEESQHIKELMNETLDRVRKEQLIVWFFELVQEQVIEARKDQVIVARKDDDDDVVVAAAAAIDDDDVVVAAAAAIVDRLGSLALQLGLSKQSLDELIGSCGWVSEKYKLKIDTEIKKNKLKIAQQLSNIKLGDLVKKNKIALTDEGVPFFDMDVDTLLGQMLQTEDQKLIKDGIDNAYRDIKSVLVSIETIAASHNQEQAKHNIADADYKKFDKEVLSDVLLKGIEEKVDSIKWQVVFEKNIDDLKVLWENLRTKFNKWAKSGKNQDLEAAIKSIFYQFQKIRELGGTFSPSLLRPDDYSIAARTLKQVLKDHHVNMALTALSPEQVKTYNDTSAKALELSEGRGLSFSVFTAKKLEFILPNKDNSELMLKAGRLLAGTTSQMLRASLISFSDGFKESFPEAQKDKYKRVVMLSNEEPVPPQPRKNKVLYLKRINNKIEEAHSANRTKKLTVNEIQALNGMNLQAAGKIKDQDLVNRITSACGYTKENESLKLAAGSVLGILGSQESTRLAMESIKETSDREINLVKRKPDVENTSGIRILSDPSSPQAATRHRIEIDKYTLSLEESKLLALAVGDKDLEKLIPEDKNEYSKVVMLSNEQPVPRLEELEKNVLYLKKINDREIKAHSLANGTKETIKLLTVDEVQALKEIENLSFFKDDDDDSGQTIEVRNQDVGQAALIKKITSACGYNHGYPKVKTYKEFIDETETKIAEIRTKNIDRVLFKGHTNHLKAAVDFVKYTQFKYGIADKPQKLLERGLNRKSANLGDKLGEKISSHIVMVVMGLGRNLANLNHTDFKKRFNKTVSSLSIFFSTNRALKKLRDTNNKRMSKLNSDKKATPKLPSKPPENISSSSKADEERTVRVAKETRNDHAFDSILQENSLPFETSTTFAEFTADTIGGTFDEGLKGNKMELHWRGVNISKINSLTDGYKGRLIDIHNFISGSIRSLGHASEAADEELVKETTEENYGEIVKNFQDLDCYMMKYIENARANKMGGGELTSEDYSKIFLDESIKKDNSEKGKQPEDHKGRLLGKIEELIKKSATLHDQTTKLLEEDYKLPPENQLSEMRKITHLRFLEKRRRLQGEIGGAIEKCEGVGKSLFPNGSGRNNANALQKLGEYVVKVETELSIDKLKEVEQTGQTYYRILMAEIDARNKLADLLKHPKGPKELQILTKSVEDSVSFLVTMRGKYLHKNCTFLEKLEKLGEMDEEGNKSLKIDIAIAKNQLLLTNLKSIASGLKRIESGGETKEDVAKKEKQLLELRRANVLTENEKLLDALKIQASYEENRLPLLINHAKNVLDDLKYRAAHTTDRFGPRTMSSTR